MGHVTIERDDEQLIRAKVASGKYADESAVVHEALRLLDERDRLDWLRAEIQKGIDDVENGRVVDFTDELMDRLLREAEEGARMGKPIRDAVKP